MPPYKAPALQESTWILKGLTYIQMKPEIFLDHVGTSEFSSQMKNPHSKPKRSRSEHKIECINITDA